MHDGRNKRNQAKARQQVEYCGDYWEDSDPTAVVGLALYPRDDDHKDQARQVNEKEHVYGVAA